MEEISGSFRAVNILPRKDLNLESHINTLSINNRKIQP